MPIESGTDLIPFGAGSANNRLEDKFSLGFLFDQSHSPLFGHIHIHNHMDLGHFVHCPQPNSFPSCQDMLLLVLKCHFVSHISRVLPLAQPSPPVFCLLHSLLDSTRHHHAFHQPLTTLLQSSSAPIALQECPGYPAALWEFRRLTKDSSPLLAPELMGRPSVCGPSATPGPLEVHDKPH